MIPYVELFVSMGDGQPRTHTLNHPQRIVDKMAELFPDVKPSSPKPKVGDRCVYVGSESGTVYEIIAIDGDFAWVIGDFLKRFTVELRDLTVTERGAS